MMIFRFPFFAFLLACVPLVCKAVNIDELLTGTPPPGVLFEIVSGDENLLETLLPGLYQDIQRLRKRHPELPIVIVTHGKEQFALLAEHRDDALALHTQIERLVTEEGIDVHVCGTHAGWKGYVPRDFPDYVDVAAAGPATINDYRELGYLVLILP